MALVSIGEFARLSRLSPKALRLYDELGLLPPARVDPGSSYRWYEFGQLDRARLVASLRKIGVPLAQIKVILSQEAEAAAEQVGVFWAGAEADHAARRELARHLVDRLNGKESVVYEVAVRDIPARSLLSLQRHVTGEPGVVALGKEFIGLFRDRPVPRLEGATGAAFLVYYEGGERGQRWPDRVVPTRSRGSGAGDRRQVPGAHPADGACPPGGVRPSGYPNGHRGPVAGRLGSPAGLGPSRTGSRQIWVSG
jgi:DNA-binding transcriptional MerR regulator